MPGSEGGDGLRSRPDGLRSRPAIGLRLGMISPAAVSIIADLAPERTGHVHARAWDQPHNQPEQKATWEIGLWWDLFGLRPCCEGIPVGYD